MTFAPWEALRNSVLFQKKEPLDIEMDFVSGEEIDGDTWYVLLNTYGEEIQSLSTVLETGADLTYEERAGVVETLTSPGWSLTITPGARKQKAYEETLRQYMANVFSMSEANFQGALSATRKIMSERKYKIDE